MSSDRYARVKALFVAARDLPAAERQAFLEERCAGDDAVRGEVERLLLHHDEDDPETLDHPLKLTPTVGSRIGPYRLVEPLGEGGMGLVFLAEQERPVRRRVALKLIRWGMDTEAVLARFDAERQALALMNHPNIATVHDAGATEEGRPYFAMEYVPGIPITEYCDRHRLTIPERLELLIQVCNGIQHAHQKGVIHRDIKPQNVLVAVRDEKPVPKIIDFGIAKAVSQRLTEHTIATELGQLIGTPEYMSPEQAEMSNLDIDTRTDVYSLGAVLYELLVGAQPFDRRRLRAAGLSEIQRILREDEPSKPSARLGTLGVEATTSANHRGAEVRALSRELRGDLDWVTMKALEKDRTRRYATAHTLGRDLQRYLDQEPVQARPPSTLYRVGKFVRRHRFGVAAGALLIVALLLGIVGTTIGLVRARRAEAKAAAEAETANQVSEFVLDLFRVSDPSEARGNTVTAREILDRGAEKIGRDLQGQPVVQARLLTTVGQVYRNLGLYEQAEPLLTEALRVRREALGERHPDVADSLQWLAWLRRFQGEYAEALSLAQQALEIRRETLDPDAPELAWSLHTVGVLQRDLGDLESARRYIEEALDLRERVLAPDHEDIGRSLYDLGWLLNLLGDYDGAEAAYERARPILEKNFGEDSTEVAWCLNDQAVVSMQRGDMESAEALFREAISILERVLGAEHPALSGLLNNLGISLWYQGDYAGARGHYQRALAISEKTLGPRHADVATTLLNLALVSRARGRYEETDRLLTRATGILQDTFGRDHPEVANLLLETATLRAMQGNEAEAGRLYRASLAIWEASTPGLDHPSVAYSQACYWAAAGKRDEALRYLKRALDLGYSKPFYLSPDLEILGGDPEYEALVAASRGD